MDKKVEERLGNIEGQLGTILKSLPSLPKLPSSPLTTKNTAAQNTQKTVCTRQVTFSETLTALQGIEMEEPCPLTGEITEVTMDFPNGCNGLVQAQFGHKGIPMLPSKKTEFIALNNATPTWRNLGEPVKKGERLWVVFRNGDAVNPHKPSVIVLIKGVE